MQKNTAIKKTSKADVKASRASHPAHISAKKSSKSAIVKCSKSKKSKSSNTNNFEEIDSIIKQNKITAESIRKQAEQCKSRLFYENWIDNCDVSSKVKNALKHILEFSRKIGPKVYAIGKIVLDMAVKVVTEVARRYPMATMGILLGLFMGYLFVLIPWVGVYMASIAAPVLAIGGGVLGGSLDAARELGVKEAVKAATEQCAKLLIKSQLGEA